MAVPGPNVQGIIRVVETLDKTVRYVSGTLNYTYVTTTTDRSSALRVRLLPAGADKGSIPVSYRLAVEVRASKNPIFIHISCFRLYSMSGTSTLVG